MDRRIMIQSLLAEALRHYIIYCRKNKIEIDEEVKKYFRERIKELSDN